MLRIIFFYCCVVVLMVSCKKTENKDTKLVTENNLTHMQSLLQNLNDSQNSEVIVVAHRADWRNAPENSIQAIQNCIDMGVDMVEIDIRVTKDGELVVIHDRTLDRTTNGKGLVKDWTLDSLKTLYLKDGLGVVTTHKIPTLEEALLTTKDKILVNLDKSYDIFDKCYQVALKTGTQDQIIIKGVKTRHEVEEQFDNYLDKVKFMPIVKLPNEKAKEIIDDYLENRPPVAFEFTLPQDNLTIINYFDDIREKGASVWINALWPKLNGGHDDEKAAFNSNVYQWYIDNHIDIIQTDRPQLLLDFLRSKKLHK